MAYMSTVYFLGIDIGTYSSKGVLVKETGEVVASRTVEHPLEMPHPGWAEHDAETTWWKDFLEIVSALLQSSNVSPRQIAAAGFSAISSAVLPINREGLPLRKAILYGIDTRTTQEIADLQQIIDEDSELRKSGVRLSSQSSSPKVLWIRRNEPEVWSKTHMVVNGSGFLLYRLTGETAMDIYDAVSFAPFVDFEHGCYTADMSKYVAPLEMLPRLTWTCEIAGKINSEGARLSGLAEGTPIITGTADAAAEAISAGLSDLGDMMVMYGSSIFFILRTPQVYNTPYFWGADFLEPGTHVLTGGMATSGSLTRWFRDQFAPLEMQAEKAGDLNAYAALAHLASGSPIGGNGLVVLPYFAGERTPLLDSDAKGVVFGLDLRHTRGDIYRAILESVGFGIRHNIDKMKEEGAQPKRILAVGGGTYNPLWMQIVSDIADIEQHIPDQQIGASYGDAFLAGIGVGRFSSTAEAARWVKIKKVIRPDSKAHAKYEDYYQVYRELYQRTRPLMQLLTGMAHGS
jgi:xylulokinase